MNIRTVFHSSLALLAASSLVSAQQETSQESVFELSPFVVQGDGADRYREDQTASGSIIAMDRLDLPMDITVIGENMIEELGLFNPDDLGNVVASVASSESVNSGGGGDNTVYTLRAFRSVPRRNGFAPGGRLYDMTGVARVEVIKGPNSVLYGQTDPGGIINFIPKRPLFTNKSTVTATYGTDEFVRLQADFTGPIGNSGVLAYRLPMSFQSYGSEIDYYNNERFVVAPSLLWRVGRTTEVFVEMEYLDQETNLADTTPWEKRDANNNWVADYDKGGLGRSFNERGPYTYGTNEQLNITGGLTTRIGDNFHLRALYTYNERDTVLRNIEPGNLNARRILTGRTYPAFMAYPYNRVRGYKLDGLYEKTIGSVETRTLIGYEYNRNFFGNSRYNSKTQLPALPNPLNGETLTRDAYSWTLGDPFNNPGNFNLVNGHPIRNFTEWTNIRLTETVQLFDNRLVFLGGIARGEVKRVISGVQTNPAQDDVTYMAGFSYKWTPTVVAFLNNTTSFAPVFNTGINDEPLDPSSGEGMELGMKFNLFDNTLFATVTYFDLTNTGLPRQVSSSESPTGQGYWINSGEEQAKGFEIEWQWNVTPQFEIYANIVHFDGKLVSPSNNIGTAGADIPRAPESSGMITLKYRFAKGSALKGLRVGLSGSYAASAPIKPNYSNPTIVSDDYFTLNGFVRYRLPSKLNTELFLYFKNLLNEKYILPGNNYGPLASVNAGVQVKF